MTDFAIPARLTAPSARAAGEAAPRPAPDGLLRGPRPCHWQWKHERCRRRRRREEYEAKRALRGRARQDRRRLLVDPRARRGGGLLPAHALGARAVGAASQHGAARGRPPGVRAPAARLRPAVRARRQRPVRHDPAHRHLQSLLPDARRHGVAGEREGQADRARGLQERPAQHRGVRGPGGRAPGADRLPQGPHARPRRARRPRAAARPGAVRVRRRRASSRRCSRAAWSPARSAPR